MRSSALQLTDVEMVDRLVDDLDTYAIDALKIRNKEGKIVPLNFSSSQRFVHDRLERQLLETARVRAIILKGRQQFISTYCTARHFRRVATEPGKRAYILTHEQKASDNLFEMVSRYYQHLPRELKPHAGAASAKELWFDKIDSGYLVGTAGTKGTGRSGTVQFFHGSEVAFWANAEDHMAGVGQALPDIDDTEGIMESTANGIGNFFHKKWQSAVAGEGDYVPIFVPWYWQTEYRRTPVPEFVPDEEEEAYGEGFGLDLAQLFWRHLKLRDDFKGDATLFDQEYPATPELAFRSAGPDCLIPVLLVAGARKARISPHPDAPKLWGLDPAEYGDDRSALAKRQGRLISEVKYWSKKGPRELAALVGMEYDREPLPKPHAIMVDTSSTIAVFEYLEGMGLPAVSIHFGEAAFEDHLYKNRRSEMWHDKLTWFMDKPCQIPDSDELQADIVNVKKKADTSRRLQLESKEKMKRDGLKSPDGGDACALTFAFKFAVTDRRSEIVRAPTEGNWRAM